MTIREQLFRLLGGFPERTSIQAQIVERAELPHYIREKLRLITEDRIIPLYLLLPRTKEIRPAILAFHQHNLEYQWGKSEVVGLVGAKDMHYAHELALRGYVVAAFDAICFEERHNPLFGAGQEAFEATRLLAEGACLQREHILDGLYVTDYLLTRPEVDSHSLGAIGHSLGGQNVLFSMLCDPRIRVGIASCGVGTVQSFIEDSIRHNFAWYVPGLLKAGDTPSLAPLLAGRSLFLSQGTKDAFFPFRGVQQFVEKATQHAQVELHFFDGGHEFPEAARNLSYEFLDNRFKKEEAQ